MDLPSVVFIMHMIISGGDNNIYLTCCNSHSPPIHFFSILIIFRDNHVDVFSQKIADKIADNISGAIVATLDSKKLSLDIDTHALIGSVAKCVQYKFKSLGCSFLTIHTL